ncbi:MAG: flagellar hook-length control protein FliK, partial [Pseudomonadota bacterium]|nr:flagellar hook-length control protein FliK [Pseudomonadota bacterium]
VDLASTNPESDKPATEAMVKSSVSLDVAASVQLTPVFPEAEIVAVELMNPAINSNGQTEAALAVQVVPSAAVIAQPVTVKASEQLLVDEALVSPPVSNQPTSSGIASPTGSDTNVAVSFADNPDFALLNSKAGLNKMVETNFTSMDHAEPAKPAVPASVLEALARPLEAQSPAARAFVVQTGVPVTVGTPQWSQAVGDRVLWLAAQNVSAAEIRLDPPELGPMQVKVSITNDQASVTFTSHNPMVRDALDQQLNRLREMFSEQGLNLVNVDVSDKSFAQQEREREEAHKSRASADVDDEELIPVATHALSVRLVDHYA